MSIQSKLYTVIVFILLIVSVVALHYYLHKIQYSVDLKLYEITKCDQKLSDIISNEQAALSNPLHPNGLSEKYATLKKMCANCHSGSKSSMLTERQATFNELFKICIDTKETYSDINVSLMDLFSNVKDIHEHHIAYLKNLIRRKVPIQDYDTDNAFERSSVNSSTEPDIIKSAISIQTSLLSIYNTFYNLQQNEDLININKDFSDRIKQFFLSVNTFKNYSLDAQDGILVEELLQTGRRFENLFIHLLAAEHKKRVLAQKLEQNRAQLMESLDMARSSIEIDSHNTYKKTKLIQITTLAFIILLGYWIVFIGKQIIDQVKRTVVETNRIQKDLSYQIKIDDSILDEFKVGYEALNSMACEVSDHIKKLDTAHMELEARVKERTADLAQANKVLRTEITDRKRAEEELAATKGMLEAAFAHSPSGILVADAPDVSIRLANHAAFGIRGGDPKTLTGIEVGQHAINWQTYHPDGSPYPSEQLPLSRAVIHGEETHDEEIIIRNENGEDRWVISNAAPIRDEQGCITAGIVVFHDITKRKQAEEALQESEENYKALFENSLDCIFLHDFEGNFIDANPAALSLLGYDRKDIPTINLPKLLDKDGLSKGVETLKIMLKQGTNVKPTEYKIRKKDCNFIYMETRGAIIYRDNRPFAVMGTARDITERKQTEQQLLRSEKLAALGEMVAGVAHEISTPLGVSLMSASYLNDTTHELNERFRSGRIELFEIEKYAKKATEASSMALSNLERAADLLNSFKHVAVDQIIEERRNFNLKTSIEDTLSSLRPKYKRTAHTVTVNCPDNLEINSYPGAFSQITTNLVMNSLVHGFEGIEKGEIILTADKKENIILFTYRDTGRGMNETTLNKLYDPFFTTSRSKGGTGLGMHIVYNLVSKTLNGQIECRSSISNGTEFIITLPLSLSVSIT